MTITALLLSFMMQPANAWRHTGTVWDRDNFPLEWYLADGPGEDSLPAGSELEVLTKSYENWEQLAPCATLTIDGLGVREGHNAGYTQDGVNTHYFDDPADEVGVGVLGQTLTIPTGDVAFTLAGDTYVYTQDSDIIYNNDISWALTEDVNSNSYSIEAVATHEIGHQLGMGHSCEEGEGCDDLDERYATMYWSIGPGMTQQAEIGDDDIEGITALYGPYASFFSDSVRSGGAPLDVCFDLEVDAGNEDIEIEWNFGDGETSVEALSFDEDGNVIPICHTYNTAGQFSVSMNVTGTQAECGEWSFTQRERAFVTVCEAPEKAEGFDGMFTYEPVEGLVYQMINQVDTSVYGCIERIRWDVFEDGSDLPSQSISAWSPKIEFPSKGKYRVVLNVGAPGDLFSAEEITINVEETSTGCSTAPVSGGFAGLLVGLMALFGRRRQD